MNTVVKQTCEYSDAFYVKVGESATLYAIGHPRLGDVVVHTSEVLSYDQDTGRIETLNTIYQCVD